MATIMPFRGYRFNTERVKNIGAAMAPPYDTIKEEEQDFFYKQHEYNIARIAKGKTLSGDTASANCYTRAADYLNDWIKKGILVRDAKPALYLYEQRVEHKNTTFTSQGVIALLELEDLTDGGMIMTCEDAKPSFKEDRYKLLSSIHANVDMINCMYIDHEKGLNNFLNEISEKKPDMEFGTRETVTNSATYHRLWVIDQQDSIAYITGVLKNKPFFITDGQNRYETALEYKKQCMQENKHHTGGESYNYIMTQLTNAYGDGMVQLPVHRVLNTKKHFSEAYFIAGAQDHFKVEKIIVDTHVDDLNVTMVKLIATPRLDETKIAVYSGGNFFYRLILKDRDYLKQLMPDKSDTYRNLDVTVLNRLILGELLNIDESNYTEYITFTKQVAKAVDAVNNDTASCAFIINPVKPEQIRAVALAGERMPERSIYLFPKAATGVVIHKFDK